MQLIDMSVALRLVRSGIFNDSVAQNVHDSSRFSYYLGQIKPFIIKKKIKADKKKQDERKRNQNCMTFQQDPKERGTHNAQKDKETIFTLKF